MAPSRGGRNYTGYIKTFNCTNGWGFIICDHADRDVFFHTKNFAGSPPQENINAKVGEKWYVKFELDLDDPTKPKAFGVRILPQAPDGDDDDWDGGGGWHSRGWHSRGGGDGDNAQGHRSSAPDDDRRGGGDRRWDASDSWSWSGRGGDRRWEHGGDRAAGREGHRWSDAAGGPSRDDRGTGRSDRRDDRDRDRGGRGASRGDSHGGRSGDDRRGDDRRGDDRGDEDRRGSDDRRGEERGRSFRDRRSRSREDRGGDRGGDRGHRGDSRTKEDVRPPPASPPRPAGDAAADKDTRPPLARAGRRGREAPPRQAGSPARLALRDAMPSHDRGGASYGDRPRGSPPRGGSSATGPRHRPDDSRGSADPTPAVEPGGRTPGEALPGSQPASWSEGGEVRLLLPRQIADALEDGALRAIERETGARLRLSFDPPRHMREQDAPVLSISSSSGATLRDAVRAGLSELERGADNPQELLVKLLLQRWIASIVIGSRGSNIRDLSRGSGTSVRIDQWPQREGDDTVETVAHIRGPARRVLNVIGWIHQEIQDRKLPERTNRRFDRSPDGDRGRGGAGASAGREERSRSLSRRPPQRQGGTARGVADPSIRRPSAAPRPTATQDPSRSRSRSAARHYSGTHLPLAYDAAADAPEATGARSRAAADAPVEDVVAEDANVVADAADATDGADADKQKPPKPPAPWRLEEHPDAPGEWYYLNTETGVTTWELPEEDVPPDAPSGRPPTPPAPYKLMEHPEAPGEWYYLNEETGDTCWEIPDDAVDHPDGS